MSERLDLEFLFRHYYGPLCRFFTKRGVPTDRSRDFAQEVFLRAARRADTYRGDGDAESWLFVIALNFWRNELRGRATEKRDAEEVPLPAPHEETESFVDGAADVFEQAVERERSRRLSEGMERLPPKMRQVLLLRVARGWRYREIAELLDISEGTVKSQMSEARKRLQHYFATMDTRQSHEEAAVR